MYNRNLLKTTVVFEFSISVNMERYSFRIIRFILFGFCVCMLFFLCRLTYQSLSVVGYHGCRLLFGIAFSYFTVLFLPSLSLSLHISSSSYLPFLWIFIQVNDDAIEIKPKSNKAPSKRVRYEQLKTKQNNVKWWKMILKWLSLDARCARQKDENKRYQFCGHKMKCKLLDDCVLDCCDSS